MSEAARVLLGHESGYGSIAELSNDECRLLHDTVAERAQHIRHLLSELEEVAGLERYQDAVARMDELHALAKRFLFARVWISEQVEVKR